MKSLRKSANLCRPMAKTKSYPILLTEDEKAALKRRMKAEKYKNFQAFLRHLLGLPPLKMGRPPRPPKQPPK